MRICRLRHVVAALIALASPLTALGQTSNASVTTAPLANAPVMGTPVLALLAVALAGVAAHFLRRGTGHVIPAISVVLVLSALAYAFPPGAIVITAGECSMQTTHMFDPNLPNVLVSQCQNAIQIVDIPPFTCAVDHSGTALDGVGSCQVGQILHYGEDCNLPECPC
ncbi:MAG TPA: hypothetical protein VMW17_11920 [Candidatus Binatia bacterium]|nr:hypothetical protein [Candidatus Binatia bacterium]